MKKTIVSKLVHARTEVEFDASWDDFKRQYAQPAWVIDYLQSEWISCRERWAKPWRLLTITMGITGNSPAESTNSVIEKWLGPSLQLSVSWALCMR
jgi:hypothetical protein